MEEILCGLLGCARVDCWRPIVSQDSRVEAIREVDHRTEIRTSPDPVVVDGLVRRELGGSLSFSKNLENIWQRYLQRMSNAAQRRSGSC